ncbi:BREX-1 system adenine-specific DNA-methyltransferase PglX [Gammaproteobacteria bacterium]|nr:BREX-1 system adenine-specific DNA-methyltransferase PglX [Gammaproteobacteria bacterium]
MAIFFQITDTTNDKALHLSQCVRASRLGEPVEQAFQIDPDRFSEIPTAPFAYWASDGEFDAFSSFLALGSSGFSAKQGLASADDFRFLRLCWEVEPDRPRWRMFAKGGAYSLFYSDVYLAVNWANDGAEIKNNRNENGGVRSNVWMLSATERTFFGRPGLTWPLRTQSGLGMRLLPAGCIFAHKGPVIFSDADDQQEIFACLAVTTSAVFSSLVELQMAFGSYEVGVIKRTPIPSMKNSDSEQLAELAHSAWSLKRRLDCVDEVSHAFILPENLIQRIRAKSTVEIVAELNDIRKTINSIVQRLYGIELPVSTEMLTPIDDAGGDDPAASMEFNAQLLLAWATGVVFGRFDWRLASGERELPPEPEPFDPLPSTSPGMLLDDAEPFHHHAGILVDDPGHLHDLAQQIESVLERVDMRAPDNLRQWLQKDFFKEHLKQYSKSRRKAPIYWPLSTASGGYTLWIYYPDLDDQTLYTAVNDFLEPKLKLIGDELSSLRAKSNRTAAEGSELERQQDLEQELIELRDTILEIAPMYKPNHDDGVQITAVPLWPLFRHKPWQKLLKDTWENLEAGEYDWAHLAYSYWPDRVREKCKTDKSLAIAHGLEELYKEPTA